MMMMMMMMMINSFHNRVEFGNFWEGPRNFGGVPPLGTPLLSPGFESRAVRPVACRSTDCDV